MKAPVTTGALPSWRPGFRVSARCQRGGSGFVGFHRIRFPPPCVDSAPACVDFVSWDGCGCGCGFCGTAVDVDLVAVDVDFVSWDGCREPLVLVEAVCEQGGMGDTTGGDDSTPPVVSDEDTAGNVAGRSRGGGEDPGGAEARMRAADGGGSVSEYPISTAFVLLTSFRSCSTDPELSRCSTPSYHGAARTQQYCERRDRPSRYNSSIIRAPDLRMFHLSGTSQRGGSGAFRTGAFKGFRLSAERATSAFRGAADEVWVVESLSPGTRRC